ncbi:pyocin knob domain-containing protein [Photorhabdus caribbeanensis]|uniref:pyocin knob domain-containing protein n=1 Tax=Photorhabdus caribbeanensis TaxID=1004165 RepID=UPI001FEB14A0|nr:pyocin knob domain-containing protein [Photorhabdus caribbeanensis]
MIETVNLAQGAVPNSRKVNGKVLTEDINITSQDIFNGQAISIPDKADLNDYQTPGLYYQGLDAQAVSGNNYPEPLAGSLVVLQAAGIIQRYFVYNSSRIYTRSLYSWNNPGAAWTPWAREYNTLNKPTVSELGLMETVTKASDALQRSGGNVTGDIIIATDSTLSWNRNTDFASIGFKNTGDDDADSYMWFRTGDNGNEYFKWLHAHHGGPTNEWMSLKSDNLRVRGYQVYHEGHRPTAAIIGAYTKSESDTRYIQDIRFGAKENAQLRESSGDTDASGYAITAVINGNRDELVDTVNRRPIQKKVNGIWMNISNI